ncbi:CCD33-like protein [Mya arenaria]|uniref:CCD33-like protein n=1 Tax=Mya arenaria TaxID=6604 RepID=A0ABY7DL39_MYAAR|nr:CCD33-like protein [Mya arenaria]
MSMMLESHTLPNIEGKAMEFTVDIQDAQFNHEGWYYLVITLHNSAVKDYSKVKVMKSDSGVWETKRQLQTDFTRQEENTPLSYFHDKRFTFRFPKGFFKNDKNFDVYILVEAFTTADTTQGKGRKVGEGKFAIYPRPNAPRMKLYAEPGEDYYNYTNVMSLLRTHSTDNITMHCGRIRSTYSMREIVPPKPRTPDTPPPRPVQKTERKTPAPTPVDSQPNTGRMSKLLKPADNRVPDRRPASPPSSWGENLSLDLNLPKSPPLPPAADGKKLDESPRSDNDKGTFSTDKSYRHVANQGNELIEVILHGASSLPLNPEGHVPLPYAVVKTKTGEDRNKKSPAMVVSVGDAASGKGLVNYRMPVSYLTPFHQYHLELNMPAKGIPSGIKTFATVTRKLPRLPADPACPNYLALEVLLMGVQRQIKTPLGPLIAVARIVPDYYNYKSDNLLSHPRNAGVVMESITFPSAHPSNFVVTERSQHGHPQPVWNHPYLFVEHRDKATLFTPGAALVIEYYVASKTILMDEDMYKNLTEDNAKLGLRINDVPVQTLIPGEEGSNMSTIDGRRPTVGVVLRLITTETPDSMVAVSNLDAIPTLDLYPPSDVPDYYRGDSPEVLNIETGRPPAATQMPETPLSPARTPKTPPDYRDGYPRGRNKNDDNDKDRGKYVLHRIKKRPLSPIKDGEMPPFTAMESVLPDYQYIFQPGEGQQPRTPTRTARHPTQSRIPEGTEDVDKNSFLLLDHQTQELGNYRDAVHKMGSDIITLRGQVQALENVNGSLRRDLANYNDASRLMKNDVEKEYLKLKNSVKTQQGQMLKLQERLKKLKKLEEACKKQESVIQQMEKVLEKHHRDRSRYQKDKASQDANEVLLQENKRLREQIEELRLAENARTWGKERASLNLKLNEAEHGFGRSAGMVLHDYPVIGEIGGGKSSRRMSPLVSFR